MITVWISIIASVIGLGFAGFLAKKIIQQKIENKEAEVVASYIQKGALTFLFKEYTFLAIFVVIVAVILALVPQLSWKLALTFVVGAAFSALAGFISLKVSTLSNIKIAEKLGQSLNLGFKLALNASSVIGFSIAGLGVLGVAGFYLIFNDPQIIYGFGLGASSIALFIRVAGGIYTKAADVGSDLVGKIENSIPEDDPRNPASIANSVGDNVGDVAGMGADLFESYVDSMVATMVLGILFLPLLGSQAIILPLILAGIGIIASVLGYLSLRFLDKVKTTQLLNSLNLITIILTLIGSFIAIKYMIGDLKIFLVLVIGIGAGLVIDLSAKYYTSVKHKPVKSIAYESKNGSITNIISGLSFGFFSLIMPVVMLAVVIYSSYYLSGFYGLALAAVSLLSTLAMILTSNTYGPIVDNSSSLAQMASMGSEIRERAEEIDTWGNTSSTVGKGFAIFSSTLTSLALLVSFSVLANLDLINLIDPKVIVGLFIGALLPFIFSALTINSVGQAAIKIINEIHRQFKEINGLISGQTEPDYKKCITIATNAALRQMILPVALAIVFPIVIGLVLGAASLAGFIIGSIVISFMLSTFMVNAGGAWDNAKKFIEAGNLDGIGSDAHKATIVGDAVGDPLKDTAGPALNILIKLMAIISIIIVPFLIK
ncbi:MAG: sodium-translocating pyrophosphatase [Candidatus Buchananbacteria bacterium]|nr:sodium-translocating pyrophosphatase [Candidatus Buchananbacteria bacterium]